MTANEVRAKYLDFFKKKGHTVVESDLLVPKDDPTLLFTGAGMNQFKEQFMGKNITYTRAASCQKCLRTADLDNVGKTPRHHTFFEMLGNFSFGDYFKKEAIQWAWEFMTREMGLGEEKLWVSVYEDDDESYDIWLNEVKVPTERIVKLGAHDNFWPADAPTKGPNGPCGPCSEIFYDWGEDTGCGKKECNPACDCGRFVEVWNLVFTQFERRSDGSLESLPSKNIDTGMGLERMASVMQGVRTNFETDLFQPIIDEIKKQLGDYAEKVSAADLCRMADHVRAAVFTIADGVSPSNEKRGYVVRKLIRRSYLRGGRKGPFLYNIVPKVAALMKDVYPEITEKREHISAIIEEEEKRFGDTLNAAMPVMDEMLAGGKKELGGEDIFKLVDTYGLPLDVIQEEAEERKISLDVEKYEHLMEGRKEQSRRGSEMASEFIFQPDKFKDAPNPEHSEDLPLEAELEFILKEGEAAEEIHEGERGELITSPQSGRLYAEAGGQVGDTGHIEKEGCHIRILNTFDVDGRKVLEVFVKKGSFSKKDKVKLHLDEGKKQKTALNHTATHLLQAALRSVLGEHVKQSGSLVDSKRLRFDFTHMKKLSDREIEKVEDMVNGWIEKEIPVCKEVKSIEQAKEEGALSFFGEKYGDTVRVVTVGDESKEFCGGTHVDNTGEIELMKITSESSVASGIRRIEALTGNNARDWLKSSLEEILRECEKLKGVEWDMEKDVEAFARDVISGKVEISRETIDEFDEKIRPAFLKARAELEKTAKKQHKQEEAGAFNEAKAALDGFIAGAVTLGEVNLVSGILEKVEMPLLRKAMGYLEKKVTSGVIILGGSKEDKACLACAVTADLVGKGLDAKKIMNAIAGKIAGGGGGKATFAQAGGKDPSGLKDALEEGRRIIEKG
jgi:alanyl-tRNA synthetase